ncbi:MAG: polysaccharide deacetylase family protein [Methylococcaceae bacterium]|nr:polysaccharide deacetylase family protein [Methylococcaceae bacterium]MDD1616111.1 polysaccharide deacetylase family protein [Methylococcaceae bacterium]OYV18583.1 MAG: Polysaccharide deacetylase [Methylococcaceae bacterium NSP1-2]
MTYYSTRLCLIIAVSIIALLHWFFALTLWWLILPSVIYLALIIYGSSVIQANFFAPAYCAANSAEKIIALSFDDGPHKEYTPKVLSLLAQHHATATFFVIGKNIHGNESLLKQIIAEGHSIGNHSYTHGFFIDFKNVQGFKDELNQTAELVFSIIGKRMKLFRPPYGVTTPNLAKAAKLLDYSIIGWNIRSLDTTNDTVEIITQRVQTQIKSGAIILFHDTSAKTIEALKQTLNFAQENGYKIVNVEQLLKIKAYE